MKSPCGKPGKETDTVKKKITALLLTLIMLCISAAACAATGLAQAQETKITMQTVREENKLPTLSSGNR